MRGETSWNDARAFCQRICLNGDLVSIKDKDMMDFIQDKVSLPDDVWLAGLKKYGYWTWYWVDGTEWNYSKWGSGQPDTWSTSYNAIRLSKSNFHWYNTPSYYATYYTPLCQCKPGS